MTDDEVVALAGHLPTIINEFVDGLRLQRQVPGKDLTGKDLTDDEVVALAGHLPTIINEFVDGLRLQRLASGMEEFGLGGG